MEEDPRNGCIQMSLKNAARYALTKAKRESLVRKSASIATHTSASDFGYLVLTPHLLASFFLGQSANHCNSLIPAGVPSSFNKIVKCLSVHPQYNLEQLNKIWSKIEPHLHEQTTIANSDKHMINTILSQIPRHTLPTIAKDVFEFLFYFTLEFV